MSIHTRTRINGDLLTVTVRPVVHAKDPDGHFEFCRACTIIGITGEREDFHAYVKRVRARNERLGHKLTHHLEMWQWRDLYRMFSAADQFATLRDSLT